MRDQEEDTIALTSRVTQRINGYKVLTSDVRVNVIKATGEMHVSGSFYVQPPVPSEFKVTPE